MAEATFSLDLHVLGPPLTFALSQDQTLHRKFWIPLYVACSGSVRGTAPTCNVEWVLYRHGLLSSFQRPIPNWVVPTRGRELFLLGPAEFVAEFVEGVCL